MRCIGDGGDGVEEIEKQALVSGSKLYLHASSLYVRLST
jgi:hypothetical protein